MSSVDEGEKNNNNVKLEFFYTHFDMQLGFICTIGPINIFMNNVGLFSSMNHMKTSFEECIHF